MCDLKKMKKIYEDCKNLNMDDYSRIFFEENDDEQKEFYIAVHNYFIQKKQKKFMDEGRY